MGKKRRKRVVCSNCNEQLKPEMNFCHQCGQENHIKRASIKILFQDFFATYFTFEAKLFKTLKVLLLQPAYLTKTYLVGKIASYVPPIRLYLFMSFVFFMLFNIMNSSSILDENKTEKNVYTEIAAAIKESIKEEKESKLHEKVNDSITKVKPDVQVAAEFEIPFEKKIKKIFSNAYEIRSFVDLLREKLPIMLFVMIPVLSFLFYIFFYGKNYLYIDHLVHVLHFQSFMFLLLTVDLLLDWVFNIELLLLIILVILGYGYLTSKRFYEKKSWGTLWRLGGIGFFYLVISGFSFLGYMLLLVKLY